MALKAPGGSTLQWARNDVFLLCFAPHACSCVVLSQFFQYLLLLVCEVSYNEFCFVMVHLLPNDFSF